MAAYDPQGRLKKNALRGTSLAVDPKRSKQRQQFQSLYEEARTEAGQGRVGMAGKLQSRAQKFGAAQRSRLAEIGAQQRGFEEEYRGAFDPEKERRFAMYEQGGGKILPKGFRSRSKEGWRRETESGQRYVAGKAAIGAKRQEFASAGSGGETGTTFAKDSLKKLRKRGKRQLTRYAERQFEKKAGTGAQSAYKKYIDDTRTRIDESYIPLQKETAERKRRMASRQELYNMFLGQ